MYPLGAFEEYLRTKQKLKFFIEFPAGTLENVTKLKHCCTRRYMKIIIVIETIRILSVYLSYICCMYKFLSIKEREKYFRAL